MKQKTYQWRIVRTEQATPRVRSLYLEPIGDRPQFIAGQYMTVTLPGLGPVEGKAYSISSAPHEPLVRLSIKHLGRFSEALVSLGVGEVLTTTAPYGFFFPESDDTHPLVFVVGGVGITPCISISKAYAATTLKRPIFIHYSNQTQQEILFHDELDQLVREQVVRSIQYYITRASSQDARYTLGRMTPDSILSSVSTSPEAEFFICGSMEFTRSLWRGLRDAGVPQHRLYTEGFF